MKVAKLRVWIPNPEEESWSPVKVSLEGDVEAVIKVLSTFKDLGWFEGGPS